MVRRVYAISRVERAEHLCRQFEINNIDYLVAVKTKLAPGHAHDDGVPFAVVAVTEDGGFKVFVKRIVGGCAVCMEAILEELSFIHNSLCL